MITLRPATMDDAEFLLRVRNDSTTRAMSVDENEVSLGRHLVWLETHLNPRRLRAATTGLYIAVDDKDGLVGYGRIDYEDDENVCCSLNYAIAPEHRGNGYGTELVQQLVRQAKLMGYSEAKCKIKRSNIASLQCALMGGVTAVEFL